MTKLYDILYHYVRHLPITVRFHRPESREGVAALPIQLIQGNWMFPPECLGQSYRIMAEGKSYEVVMGVGNVCHELYQNRVLISSKYNLFAYGLREVKEIPNLMIRVDSEAFELPFGRHCLCNEEVLMGVCNQIRETILPAYFKALTGTFHNSSLPSAADTLQRIEEMACGLMLCYPYIPAWADFPVFRMVGGKRLSLFELKKESYQKTTIFIEAEKNEGIDYSVFNAPVLAFEQPRGALEVIKNEFGHSIINLNDQDTVIEKPASDANDLSEEERRFERYLVFQPKNVILERLMGMDRNAASSRKSELLQAEIEDYVGICEEAKTAEKDFSQIKWKVNYLVERDGKTPCIRRKFLYREGKITLNLCHPEIREFIELASLNPNLSAHWAMAMCISDPKLLRHITPEAREDLMLIDAMARIDSGIISSPAEENNDEDISRDMIDFLKNCINRPWNRY